MAFFDPEKKESKPILKFFSDKKVLVADPSGSTRMTIKKMMTNLGVPLPNIEMAEDFPMAVEAIKKHKVNFIFCNINIGGKSAIDLYNEHISVVHHRLKAGFFILSDDNSPAAATVVLDYEIDGYVPIPFTLDGVQTAVLNSIKNKIKPSKYLKGIDEGRAALLSNNLEAALGILEEVLKLSKKPTMAHYLMGKIFIQKKNMGQAKASFKEGLTFNPKHYKCLSGLYKVYSDLKDYKEAYEVANTLMGNFPVHPAKIPEYTKLSIQNADYESVITFAEIIHKMKIKDSIVRVHLSAGLTICGKFLFSIDKRKEAKSALEDAAKLSDSKKEIIQGILNALLDNNEDEFAHEVLEKYAGDALDENTFDLLVFQMGIASAPPPKILTNGRALLNRGIKEKSIFIPMMDAMKQLKLPMEKIEDFHFEMIKAFPDEREKILGKFEQYKKLKSES